MRKSAAALAVALLSIDRLRYVSAQEGGTWDPNGRPPMPPAAGTTPPPTGH